MVETVASENPERVVARITLFSHSRDYFLDHEEAELAEAFRGTLRTIVEDCNHEHVHLFDGPDLLPTASGMTTDLVHPGDDAMITIGERLAEELEAVGFDHRDRQSV